MTVTAAVLVDEIESSGRPEGRRESLYMSEGEESEIQKKDNGEEEKSRKERAPKQSLRRPDRIHDAQCDARCSVEDARHEEREIHHAQPPQRRGASFVVPKQQ